MVAKLNFPILGWGWIPAERQALEGIVECGINLAGFVHSPDLDAVAGVGLKALVYDSRASGYDFRHVDEQQMRSNLASLLNEVGHHQALYGIYLKDEPNAADFPGLAVAVNILKELAPDILAYINLFPNYATSQQLGTETYDEHLRQYIDIVHPDVVSYDHYALMEGGSLRDSYFANLESIRRLSNQNGLPFWNIVLANAHFNYREPDPAGLRFQAYTTLAYGGKGLSYFTYFTPATGNYRCAPVDQFGNRTTTWDYLRNVNLQLQTLAPVVAGLQSVRVYHQGEMPAGCLPAPADSLVKKVKGDEKASFLVGELVDPEGIPWVIVVNKDCYRSTWFALDLQRSEGKIDILSPYNGKLSPLAGEDNWLAPGQGVLLRLAPGS
jgi:hypothetical protein